LSTIGSQITAHNKKNLDLEDDVREYTKAMTPLILHTLQDTALKASQHPLYENRDFYLVFVKNVDRILGQPKFQCWARRSCPTPVYKQDVYKYHHLSGEIEFLWCIPSAQRYYHILANRQKYFENKNTKRLAQFVCLMESGELLRWVLKENGELPDAIITINKEPSGK
jgi:hypothetical protein